MTSKTKTNSKKTSITSPVERVVVIGTDGYGLVYGRIRATDAEIVASKSCTVYRCRHIARWYGGLGGITSLVATGPTTGSRIGAECPSALVTSIRNVFFCSDVAIAAFDAMVPAS